MKPKSEIPASKYIGWREEWDYDRLRKKPDKFLKNTFRDPTPTEKKNFLLNRAKLYGSLGVIGTIIGGAKSSNLKGTLLGGATGLTAAGAADLYGRLHHKKKAKIAREEYYRRHPDEKTYSVKRYSGRN